MSAKPIYLDYQATTPVDPRVLDVMLPYFCEVFGNPHSEEHLFGQEAGAAVETAREQVAALIGAQSREVTFTSGATEANNLLLIGAARALRQRGKEHLITCATEHKAVLEVFVYLSDEGFDVTVLPVEEDGLLDVQRLEEVLRPQTGLVSVMAANNEIGVLQPLRAIGELCRSRGIVFHTDAVQAVGKVALDVVALRIDLLSLSAHKLYGPKGIGAAFVRRDLKLKIAPLHRGGGQERGLRSGTLPTPLCVGLGAACALSGQLMAEEDSRLLGLRERFLSRLCQAGADPKVNGSLVDRLPGNLNLSFEGVDAEALLMSVRGHLAIASGSACTTHSLEPSHVVDALGFDQDRVEGAIRVGFGRFTQEEDVENAALLLATAVGRLRKVRYVAPLAVGEEF